MSTLYELADLRDVIESALAESEGELTDDLAAKLDAWEGAFADKVERVALYISEQERVAEATAAEAKALLARASARTNRADALRRYLYDTLARVGTTKVKGTLKDVSIVKNPPSVQEVIPTDAADFRNVMCYAADLVRHTPETFEWNLRAVAHAFKIGAVPEDVAKRVRLTQTARLEIK